MPDFAEHIATLNRELVRLGDDGEEIVAASKRLASEQARYTFLYSALQKLARELAVRESNVLAHSPVTPEEFFTDPQFTGRSDSIYPALLQGLCELNAWEWDDKGGGYIGRYSEAVLTGAIGSGKTTMALHTLKYQLYLLACVKNPHGFWNLDPDSEIVIPFQSATGKLAKGVDFERFSAMIDSSEWFRKNFDYDRSMTSELKFPNRIKVLPLTSTDTSALGQNVIFGILEELNFMDVIAQSARSVNEAEYDQAQALYNTIARRRESRFLRRGRLPGVLCMVSSRNYPGQFTDRKEEEARTNPRIFVWDKRVWEIHPKGTYSDEMFYVFKGDDTRKPMILLPEEKIDPADRENFVAVPVDFRHQFEADIYAALRDIAGVATRSKHPFIYDPTVIGDLMENELKSVFGHPSCDFVKRACVIHPERIEDPDEPRFAHIDLGQTSDSTGLAIGRVIGFKEIDYGEDELELMPEIVFDGVLDICPPPGGEIIFSKVRKIIYTLRSMGMNIRWVSMDSWQSTDTIQTLRQRGFSTGLISLDKTPLVYEVAKSAMYDRRVHVPAHPKLQRELAQLQRDPETRKIDHPPNGCFTAETRVALADGTCPTFAELAQRAEPFFVYAIGPQGVEIARARNARVTKRASELVEVMLDNYAVIRATPEHRFMLLDGGFVEAQDLTPDMALMPLYRSREGRGGWAGYERVWCPVREQRLLTHHLAVGSVGGGMIVHHRDGVKHNNDPRNLEMLSRHAHLALHGRELWAQRRAAMRAGHARYYEDAARRDEQAERMRETRKRLPHRFSTQRNHRVLSVVRVPGSELVYDLTVPKLKNFALASGVFVHNSKDCSDAFAAVVYGLTMRRELWVKHKALAAMARFLRRTQTTENKMEDPNNSEASDE